MRTGGRCWGRGQSGEPRGSPAVPAGRGAAPEGRGGPRAPRQPAAGSGRSEQVAGSGDAHSRGRLSRGPLQRDSAKARGECERDCVCECAHRPGRAGTRERAVAHVHAPWACGGSALLRRLVWSAGRSRSAAGPGGDARPCQRRTRPPCCGEARWAPAPPPMLHPRLGPGCPHAAVLPAPRLRGTPARLGSAMGGHDAHSWSRLWRPHGRKPLGARQGAPRGTAAGRLFHTAEDSPFWGGVPHKGAALWGPKLAARRPLGAAHLSTEHPFPPFLEASRGSRAPALRTEGASSPHCQLQVHSGTPGPQSLCI